MDEKNEPVEPLFKYLRIACDLREIVKSDSISEVFATEKIIAVGSSWGNLYILDHDGNVNCNKKFPKHIVAVNQISMDMKGEYMASCSDGGEVRIFFVVIDNKKAKLLFISGSHQLFVRGR
jgi:vacuolar protein sorting-associated protein 41